MFQDKVRQSFTKVKEDISSLSERVEGIEAKLDKILEKISQSGKYGGNEAPTLQIPLDQSKSSTGNEGVYSLNHSTNNHSTNNHSLNIQSLKKSLEKRIDNLTNQEFLVFLTIYQLE